MTSNYDTEHFAALYKGRVNLLEMMEHQEYNVNEYAGFKTNELHAMIKNAQLDMLVENKRQKVYIKFFEICEKKPKLLNKQVIDEMLEDLYVLEEILSPNDTLMIISHSEPNDTIKNHIKHIWEEKHQHVVIINIKRLQYNILNHSYVPPHFVMNDMETEKLRSQYHIKNDNQLPELSRFDPVAQIICLKPGNICKIVRPSKNAISANYYRICKNK